MLSVHAKRAENVSAARVVEIVQAVTAAADKIVVRVIMNDEL